MTSESSSARVIPHKSKPRARSITQQESYSNQPKWLSHCRELLRKTDSDPKLLCEQCLEVFDSIIAAEGDGLIADEGLKEVFVRLYLDPIIYQHAQDTYTLLKNIQADLITSREVRVNWDKIFTSIDYLLSWYMRRVRNLKYLTNIDTGSEDASLFGVQVVHDVVENGISGLEVTCGARIAGYAGQELWLEVQLLNEGKPVHVKASAKGWSQQALYPRIVNGATLPLQFGLPVHVSSQFKIFDKLRVFIPYGILDLPSGLYSTNLLLSLSDSRSEDLASASCLTLLRLVDEQHRASSATPGEVGAWKFNTQTGEFIDASSLKISSSIRGAWEEPCLELEYSGLLIGRDCEEVYVEARIMSSKGEMAMSVAPSYEDEEGYFIARERLDVEQDLFCFSNNKIAIPVRAFGISENADWHLELSLVGADGNFICSLLRKINKAQSLWCGNIDELYTGERKLSQSLSAEVSLTEGSVDILVSDLNTKSSNTITYCWLSPRWLGAEASKIESSYLVYGVRADVNRSFVDKLAFSVQFGDLSRFLGVDSSEELEFVVTLMQFDHLGRCLKSAQDFITIPSSSLKQVKRNTLKTSEEAQIISLKAFYDKESKSYLGQALLNISARDLEKGSYVYYELLDQDAKALSFDSEGEKVPGRMGLAATLPKSLLRDGVVQISWPFRIPLLEKGLFSGGKSYQVKLVIFDSAGKISDSFKLPLNGTEQGAGIDQSSLEDSLASFVRLAK